MPRSPALQVRRSTAAGPGMMGRVADVQERRGLRICAVELVVVALVVSPVHRCAGRPGGGPLALPAGAPPERRREVRVEAGRGVVGDRYFGRAAHAAAAVTVVDAVALESVADELGVPRFDPALARRNVVLRRVDGAPLGLEALRGHVLSLDCGDGPVHLAGGRPASPCAWMDVLLAPGAHAGLRGRGGLRCEPVGSGVLRVGPASLLISPAPDPC